MPWWEHETAAEPLLELILEAIRDAGGRGPVLGYVDARAPDRGIPRPYQALQELAPELISLETPSTSPTSEIGLKVLGALKAEPQAREIHRGFVTIVRALTDRLGREEFLSPAEPQPVIVHAHELKTLLGRDPVPELGVVGHFLDQEGIGAVRWSGDPGSPWSIEIDHRIRLYAGITSVYDYLRIRYPEAG